MKLPDDTSQTLDVRRHISGGTLLRFGRQEIVLSPHDALEYAKAVLASIDIKFDMIMPPPGFDKNMRKRFNG